MTTTTHAPLRVDPLLPLPEHPPRLGPISRRLLLRLVAALLVVEAVGAWLVTTGSDAGAGSRHVADLPRCRLPVRRLADPVRRHGRADGRRDRAVVGSERALRDPARVARERGRCRPRSPTGRACSSRPERRGRGRSRSPSSLAVVVRRRRRLPVREALPDEAGAGARAQRVPGDGRPPSSASRCVREPDAMDVELLRWGYALAHQPDDGLVGLRLGRAVPRRHAAALPAQRDVLGAQPVRRQLRAERRRPARRDASPSSSRSTPTCACGSTGARSTCSATSIRTPTRSSATTSCSPRSSATCSTSTRPPPGRTASTSRAR